MKKAVEELVSSLEDRTSKKGAPVYPAFRDRRYTPFMLAKENIREFTPKSRDVRVSSVDGGNIEIIKSPDTSIHLVRIYFNIFRGKSRLSAREIPQKLDFYALARSFEKDGGIYYSTKLIPFDASHRKFLPKEEHLVFDSYDPTIANGVFRTPISKIGELSRRFAEWEISRHIIESELDKGDILIRDGSLETHVTNESTYSEKAYDSAVTRGVIFTGIAKTSSLLASDGRSLASSISSLKGQQSGNSAWLYHPVASSQHPCHRAEMYYVRLNSSSPYTFRFEIHDRQKESASVAIEELASHSKDISFPGYPYPLIDADKNARVRFSEINFHRTFIARHMRDKDSAQELSQSVASTDAHATLDRIV